MTLSSLTGYITCTGRPRVEIRSGVITLCVIVTEVIGGAVPAEGDPLLSNLPPCSCSSAHLGDDAASQIPVRGARRRAVLTVDDPTAIKTALV